MIKTSTLLVYLVSFFCLVCHLDGKAQTWLDVNSAELAGGRGANLAFALAQNGTPYVAYSNPIMGGRATVKKFDGAHWVKVGAEGISTDYAGELAIAIDTNNVPYLAYTDNAANGQLSIKKFDGTNWVVVGTGLQTNKYPNGLRLAISSTGTPYVAYSENSQGWVKMLNGTNWQTIGTGSFALPQTEKLAFALDAQNTPYIAYTDATKNGQAFVQRWDGSKWANIGTDAIAAGTALDLSIIVGNNGKPYITYREFNGAALNKLGTTKVKQFDGAKWVEVSTTGISDSWIYFAALGIDNNNTLYVAYRESAAGIGNPGQTKVKRLHGPEWEEIGTSNFTSGPVNDVFLSIANNGSLYVAFADVVKARAATVLRLDIPTLKIASKAPTKLALAASNDNGVSANDNITNVALPTITGMADPKAQVTIFADKIAAGTTLADSNGYWEFTFTTALAAGNRTIYATATDPDGLTSAPSSSISVTLDFTAPVVSGAANQGIYKTDKIVTYTGGTATLNNAPFTSGTLITAEGTHTLIASDVAGNTTTVLFTIDKTAPVASIVINNNAATTNNNEVILTITAPDATQMRFYDNDDNLVWSAWEPVSATKNWTLPTGNGSKWIKLQVRDAAGNVSASVSDNITLDQTAPTVSFSCTEVSPTSNNNIPVKINFSEDVTNFTAAAVTVTNATKGTFAGSGRYYTLYVKPVALTGGNSTIITVNVPAGVTADASGNKNTASATFSLTYAAPVTAPKVENIAYNVLSTSSVTLGGNVTSSGGSVVSARGVVYSSTSTSPSINSSKVLLGTGEGNFTTTLTTLKAGVTYYARAFATNAIGTSYGAVQKFTTTTTTAKATSVAEPVNINASAALTAYPNPFGQQATIEFTYNTTTTYTIAVYDMNGTQVQTLPAGTARAGEKVQVSLSGEKLINGIYTVRLSTAAGVQNLKLICGK
ncbi:T9SS type A sorting domain-containing protein [Adhaeribacter swui]|uniref:T9SS type A sorting domain-containing protein n=1 Tax=Adhaeribacter swui TaxID=2086471 RepID=A0A7G7GAF5_9BACT|nr:Ig-like domain-containing protein [Adhaeribacter swui]QNF34139.1 T9SS type A sorting domain-containing protein [Adhaeribacter swui]